MRIGKYRTVTAENFKLLDEAVNRLLAKDWQPFGSPYVTEDPEVKASGIKDLLVCQAMVLATEPNGIAAPAGA